MKRSMMSLLCAAWAAVVLVVPTTATGQETPVLRPGQSQPLSEGMTKYLETQKKLEKILPEFSVRDGELQKTLQILSETAGVNVVVDWSRLKPEGVTKNAPVTLRLTNVTCNEAMQCLLGSVKSGNPLDFIINDGVVAVSRRDDLRPDDQETCVYDVVDLMDVEEPELCEKRLERLLDIITNTIDPDSWIRNGGVHGSIKTLDQMLIVNHTPKVHLQLRALLERMRAVRKQREHSPVRQAKRTAAMVEVVERIGDVAFEPTMMGMIAIGGLKDDVAREPAEVCEDLEQLLERTETLGLRNAIRLTLRELYRQTDDREKVLVHLRGMLSENDEAAADEDGKDEEDDKDEEDED